MRSSFNPSASISPEVNATFCLRLQPVVISSIVFTPGELVRGVIYEVPLEEMLRLDEVESVPQGLYARETFLVLGEDREFHEADLYRVVKPEGPFTPARSYVELMLEGAEEHGLDQEYIEELKELLGTLG
jgi:hypothetical protein